MWLPAMPSAAIAITRRRLNAGYRYLKVKCAGCRENNMVDLANHPAPTWSIACAASRARCSAAIPTSAAHLVRLRQQGHAERRRRALLSDQRDRD